MQRLFFRPPFGDVFDGEQDRRRAVARLQEAPGVEPHRLLADAVELALDREAVELVVARENLLQQPAQLGTVPVTVAQLVQQPAFRFLARHLESPVKRVVGRPQAEFGIEHDERLADRRHDALGVLLGALHRVHIDEQQDHAVNLVVQRLVRAEAQRVPAAVLVADRTFLDDDRFDHLREEWLQVGQAVEVELEIGQRPAHVGGNQVEQFFRRRREPPDAEVRPEHDDGHLDAAEQVHEVVVEPVRFLVAVVQLGIDGGQLFVAGLDFFLRGFEFFVGALQLLVRRLDLLVRRLQFLVRGLLLLDHRLQVFAGGGQLQGQARVVGDGQVVYARSVRRRG